MVGQYSSVSGTFIFKPLFFKGCVSGIFHRADIAQRTFSYRTWGWKMAVRSRKLVGKRSVFVSGGKISKKGRSWKTLGILWGDFNLRLAGNDTLCHNLFMVSFL